MGGGEIQLHRYGAQNIYLNGNPQITYFKSVYKRHSNFAMETIRLDFDSNNSLSFTQNAVDNTLVCTIPRNADLIDKIYLSLSLPDIYSGYVHESGIPGDGTAIAYEFQWIPNIGCQIIKKCSLTIGGNVISELYGQWIEIWHEMWQDTAAKNNFDLMTGHQPDLFLPAHNGRNRGFYPTSTLEKYLNTNPDSNNYTFTNFKKNSFLQPPSILGRQLYIPLPFWFTSNPGLALPLVALQYHDVKLQFELRPIQELYTIIETQGPFKKTRVKPDPTKAHHHIGNFITSIPPNTFSEDLDSLSDGQSNIQGWNMDLHILANYIFLDQDERRRFSMNNHEYLIEQTYRQDFYGISGRKALKLNFNHPVKYIVWCGQRSDVDETIGGSLGSGFNNYTNFKSEYIHPSSPAYVTDLGKTKDDLLYYYTFTDPTSGNETIGIQSSRITDWNTTGELLSKEKASKEKIQYYANQLAASDSNNMETAEANYQQAINESEISLIPNKFNFRFYDENIIQNSRLIFDGVERYSTRDSIFFQNVQSYQHKFRCNKPGIYFYSFALDPNSNQPSGACNMSRIDNVELEVETTDLRNKSYNFTPYTYNIFVYAINYNILKITGGMAGTAYSN